MSLIKRELNKYLICDISNIVLDYCNTQYSYLTDIKRLHINNEIKIINYIRNCMTHCCYPFNNNSFEILLLTRLFIMNNINIFKPLTFHYFSNLFNNININRIIKYYQWYDPFNDLYCTPNKYPITFLE